jgi:UDP-N-acetylmuramate--alanine ligase
MPERLNIHDIKKAYFLGIGGIGMSAVVRYFNSIGISVSGYDKTQTPLTDALALEGVSIHFDDNADLFPSDIDVVVYTPAIPVDNRIFNYCKSLDIPLLKRSDVLQLISENSFNICIAGTHGKTTTTAMVGHVLRDSGFGCNAFLGGISSNYNTNFWSNAKNVCVIEADEYDRSFLKLSPDVISISSMDPDHLEIYGTASEMEDAFVAFSNKLKPGGLLLYKKGIARAGEFKAPMQLSFGAEENDASIHVDNCIVNKGAFEYSVAGPGWILDKLCLHMGGMHNVENSLVAIAVAKFLGIDDDRIRSAVASFKGVKRRFEYIHKSENCVYIDDYAHHPAELNALLKGVRKMFPSKKCTLIFQPHLFSRTRDLAAEFAESLDLADEVILLPVYPARELPIPGVDSSLIAGQMKSKVRLYSLEEIPECISDKTPELIITAGAGNIDTLVEPIRKILISKAC